MALKKRTGKVSVRESQVGHERIDLECKVCFRLVENVSAMIRAITCDICVARMAAPPDRPKPKASEEKRPRGWHLMAEYISPSGVVYHKGREVNGAFKKTDSQTASVVGAKSPRGRKRKSKAKRRGKKG